MNKELSKLMNDYLANVGVMYIKLHNLHWNVKGKQFKAVHEYLETLYDAMAEVLDSVAESLKMEGEMPLASMKDYLKAASIHELKSSEIGVDEALDSVLADMEILKEQAEAIRAEADKSDCYNVVSMMEDDLGDYKKNIWFIKSMLK